jgi:hypothetical protein
MTPAEEAIITKLSELDNKIDMLNKNQAMMRPDIIEHILRILLQYWRDEQARHRERAWS